MRISFKHQGKILGAEIVAYQYDEEDEILYFVMLNDQVMRFLGVSSTVAEGITRKLDEEGKVDLSHLCALTERMLAEEGEDDAALLEQAAIEDVDIGVSKVAQFGTWIIAIAATVAMLLVRQFCNNYEIAGKIFAVAGFVVAGVGGFFAFMANEDEYRIRRAGTLASVLGILIMVAPMFMLR